MSIIEGMECTDSCHVIGSLPGKGQNCERDEQDINIEMKTSLIRDNQSS